VEGTQILVAVDGSPAASAAVEQALKLAAAMKGSVRFVHASPRLAADLYAAYPVEGPPREELLARDPVLGDAFARAQESGVPAEVEVISDVRGTADLAAAIAAIAEGVGASMIVTGSRGRGPVAGSVLGSVSHNLIKWSTLPVLIVHPAPEKEPAQP
jgi:nucleotide-binding universal stress UspA family protein